MLAAALGGVVVTAGIAGGITVNTVKRLTEIFPLCDYCTSVSASMELQGSQGFTGSLEYVGDNF